MFPAFSHAHDHMSMTTLSLLEQQQDRRKSQCPGAALLLNSTGDYPVVVWGFLN